MVKDHISWRRNQGNMTTERDDDDYDGVPRGGGWRREGAAPAAIARFPLHAPGGEDAAAVQPLMRWESVGYTDSRSPAAPRVFGDVPSFDDLDTDEMWVPRAPTRAPCTGRTIVLYTCAVALVWLLAFGVVILVQRLRESAQQPPQEPKSCYLWRIPQGASWFDATPAQQAAARTAAANASWVPQRAQIFVYWHVFTDGLGNRSQEVISRQYQLLQSSGLLGAATEVRIGYVGQAPLELPSWHKMRVVARAPNGTVWGTSGNECVTTHALWEAATGWGLDNSSSAANQSTLSPLPRQQQQQQQQQQQRRIILYMHTRGVTHPETGSPQNDWTLMLEHRMVQQWRIPAALLDDAATGVLTVGCDKNRVTWQGYTGWTYPGNFWWAVSDYLAALDDPVQHATHGTPYYLCSEYWILSLGWPRDPPEDDATKHFVLLSTGPEAGLEGSLTPYSDAIPPHMYNCTDSAGLPPRSPCAPVDLAVCHGRCCRRRESLLVANAVP